MAGSTSPRRTPRKATGPTPPKTPVGNWARIRSEAQATRVATPDYVFDATEPPILIAAPTATWQQVGLASCYDDNGEVMVSRSEQFLRCICGDAFDEVWAVVRGEHISVTGGLIADIAEHFKDDIEAEAAALPGGTGASST